MHINIEYAFGEATAIVGGWYSKSKAGRDYMPNGDYGYPEEPSEFDIHSFLVGGDEILETLQEMYVKTRDGKFIPYLESIDDDLCAIADEYYLARGEE